MSRNKFIEKSISSFTPAEPVEVTVPSGAPTGATPFPFPSLAKSCQDLDCEEGYQCKLVVDKEKNGNRKPVPACQPIQCPLRYTQ